MPSPISAMNDNGSPKLTGIKQIVKLKQMIHKWQSVTLGSKVNSQRSDVDKEGISPIIKQRLTDVTCCDSDEESCYSPSPRPSPGPPPDVPKGYLAVYVGTELQRFIIPTSYLSHSIFKALLEKAADEFGFEHHGGLTIPCEIETFKSLLRSMEHEQKHPHGDSSAGSSRTIEESN